MKNINADSTIGTYSIRQAHQMTMEATDHLYGVSYTVHQNSHLILKINLIFKMSSHKISIDNEMSGVENMLTAETNV